MKNKDIAFGILKAIAIVTALLLMLWFFFKIQALILYVGIASVISLIGRPIILFFKTRLKFSNTLATFITLGMVIGVFSLFAYIFVPIIIEESKNIQNIDFENVKRDLNELNMQASDYLGVEQIDFVEAVKNTEYVKNFDSEVVPSFFDIFFSNLGNAIVGVFSVLFISFFLLKEEKLINNSVTVFAKKGSEHRYLKALYKIRLLLSRYFTGLVFQILILTVFYTVLLLFFDIENIVAIAMICAFLNIIPYLGPLLGMIIMVLVITSNNLGADFSSELLPQLTYVVIGYSIAQLFDNLITQPIIFGKSVKSHPLEIFLVILIGGFVFGIGGMILAVPTYTTLKVIAKEFLSDYKIVKRLTKDM